MAYQADYAGYYTMKWHDDEQNALKRWFDNYKVDRYAFFASDCEWLVVKEVPCACKARSKRIVCEIGDDGRGTKREVIMDHTTPPAPVLTFAAKRRWEPPPPKTAEQIRREMEWDMMMARGYEPVRRPKYRAMPRMWTFEAAAMAMDTIEVEYEIEWVKRRPAYWEQPQVAYTPPPPPKHRRNV